MKRTLLERVLDESFRPVRYSELLAGPLLTEQAPFEDAHRRAIWAELRNLQTWSQHFPDQAWESAREFSALVHYLHGGQKPSWYDEE